MKTHVEMMEDEMKTLSKEMEKISKTSESINETLNPKKQRIQRLSKVSELLEKIQFLLELPKRLNQCLESKTFAVAVEYFNSTFGTLKKFSHMPSFKVRICSFFIHFFFWKKITYN